MAYISYISDDDAPARLRKSYDRCRDADGRVDNILRIHGHNPASLDAHVRLYTTLMRGRSELSAVQREMIAVVVSSINECHY